jgi:hypothetical protein
MFVWGANIAASQVADALKDVFPFAKKHKAASALAMTLDITTVLCYDLPDRIGVRTSTGQLAAVHNEILVTDRAPLKPAL